MNIKISLIILFLASYSWAIAQVGIGNPAPDTSSVLDLSNSRSRGLLLPKTVTTAVMSETVGMLYYYNDYIYYKQSDGYNAIEPSDSISLVENGSFLIGTSTSKNLSINSKEIQSRNSGTGSDLTVNEQGGDVLLGSETYPVSIKATNKIKEYDHNTQTYYDLIPAGSIIMWYGSSSSIPTGWALCDGNTYPRSNSSGTIITPNLSGRFVIPAGDNGGSSYSAHDVGGQDAVSLSAGELPAHNHTGTATSAGSHSHDVPNAVSYTGDASNSNKNGKDGESLAISETGYAGNHSHSVTIYNAGSSVGHENRPKYYALAYIIKL